MKPKKNTENKIKEFIDTIYFIGLDLIPTFDDINSVNDNWIWLAAHINLFSEGLLTKTTDAPGIIKVNGDKTGIDLTVLTAKNWNVI